MKTLRAPSPADPIIQAVHELILAHPVAAYAVAVLALAWLARVVARQF